MKMVYGVKDRPVWYKVLVFALQQVLAILAATIAVPFLVGNGMSQSAALFGAGAGTIVYLLFTKFKSPVFLGSSFAFIPSLAAAFAGATTMQLGYAGLIIGAVMAGLVYVIISFIVKFAGVKWISKIMPAVVIGPTVAIIGLSLAGTAIQQLLGYAQYNGVQSAYVMDKTALLCLLCGLITLGTTVACSVFGKKMAKMIPFILGILAGYCAALIITVIGIATKDVTLQIIDFSTFQNMQWIPDFTFIEAFKGFAEITPGYIGTIAVAYVPVAFVVFAEHIADHKNLSTIIEHDLLEDPGLNRTLLGDGVGSIVGAIFGGCPNTTYGESVGCVAISGNASIITIFVTAIICMVASFFAPFVTFLASIPACVMGGVCIALYGFIAVSGLKMIQKVDLNDNKNLFVVSVILIVGVGGMAMLFGQVKLTNIAAALILGIITNVCLGLKKSEPTEEEPTAAEQPEAEQSAEAETTSEKAE